MFAEMMKEICKKRNSCFGCPFEMTCHEMTSGRPMDWSNEEVQRYNRMLDKAIARCVREVTKGAAD